MSGEMAGPATTAPPMGDASSVTGDVAAIGSADEQTIRLRRRCSFLWSLDTGGVLATVRFMVCDRVAGHRGCHTGRVFRLHTSNTGASVIGWMRKAGAP